MNRKLILTCLLMLTILLSACGGTTATPTTVAPTPTATTSTAASPTDTVAATDPTATTVEAAATATTAEAAATATTSTTTEATATTATADATATTATTTSEDTTPKVVAATEAFLATLSDTEKAAVSFDWTDDAQKTRWSNLPEGLYTRDGLMWGNMSDASKEAWLAVMKVTLSTEGYNRVIAEWTADDQLATGSDGGPGGGSLQYGMQYYWVAIIGTPSTTEPWQWQWGGHHVTVNATVSGTEIALTPSFIGCQPCSYTDASGNTIRPLGDIEDEAVALVNSLDATQQQAAILGSTYIDLVLGPGQDGKTIQAEGLPASQMTDEQKAAFLKLISHYAGLINEEDAAARIADITANLDQTYFAWYGPTTAGSASYFRITGPSVVIEYSPQSMGGNAANHVHGIYRDPTNEYGAAIIK